MKSLRIRDKNSDFDGRTLQLGDLSQINPQKAITALKHRMAVQKAVDLIGARMQDLPTLAELASFSGLSRTYLSFVFKEVTGMRLQDYLTRLRFDKAKDLLANIDLKIKQVAYETGFSYPNYFCRTFKKKTGLNPSNWRVRRIISGRDHN